MIANPLHFAFESLILDLPGIQYFLVLTLYLIERISDNFRVCSPQSPERRRQIRVLDAVRLLIRIRLSRAAFKTGLFRCRFPLHVYTDDVLYICGRDPTEERKALVDCEEQIVVPVWCIWPTGIEDVESGVDVKVIFASGALGDCGCDVKCSDMEGLFLGCAVNKFDCRYDRSALPYDQ